MPPPTAAGKLARPAARYRPGKAAGAEQQQQLDSDSDAEQEREEQQRLRGEAKSLGSFARPQRTAGIVIQQGNAAIDLSGVTVGAKPKQPPQESESEYETDTDQEASPPPAAAKPVFRTSAQRAAAEAQVKKRESSEEYETDSGDEEESEEEEKPKVLMKPMFVPKRARVTIPLAPTEEGDAGEGDAVAAAEKKAVEEAEKRRQESRAAAVETIRRDINEKKAQEAVPDLDDTDDVDPAAEFAAWRIRELERLKRDREAIKTKEEEREDIERRRNMPAEQRDREDFERAEKSRKEKQKGKQGFMQKYYHKGAFFQDMDILKKHDFTEATQGDVDKSMLPSILQVRDYGKKSRSKYTHLAAEDTTRAGDDPRFKKASGSANSAFSNQAASSSKSAGQGCFNCGGPHLRRDCPNAPGAAGGAGGAERTGANRDAAEGDQGWGSRAAPPPSRDRDERNYSAGEKRHRSRSPRERDGREGKAPRYEDRHRDSARSHGDRERSSGHRKDRSWRSRSKSPRGDRGAAPRDPREREREERNYERREERNRRRDWERERDRDWKR